MSSSEVNNLFVDDYYINWLISFLKENKKISDDGMILFSKTITDEDKHNINMLSEFLNYIMSYASKNYIDYNHEIYGYNYVIKKDDCLIKVGIRNVDGSQAYAETTSDIDQYILYDDLKNNVSLERTDKINDLFSELNNVIEHLSDYGVNIEMDEQLNNNYVLTRRK